MMQDMYSSGDPNVRQESQGAASAPGTRVYYPNAGLRADRWRYPRGAGKVPTVLIMGDDGRVAAIHLEKHRD